MQGYKLNLTFYSPCVFHHPPMLDAILSYCLQRESHRYIGYYAGTWRDREYDGINRLPEVLEFYSEIPLANAAQYDAACSALRRSWKKRFEPKYQHLRTSAGPSAASKRPSDNTARSTCHFRAGNREAGLFYWRWARAIELLEPWIRARSARSRLKGSSDRESGLAAVRPERDRGTQTPSGSCRDCRETPEFKNGQYAPWRPPYGDAQTMRVVYAR